MPDASWILANEGPVRLGIFFGSLLAWVAVERFSPAVVRAQPLLRRWTANLGLSALSAVFVGLLLRGLTVLAALWAQMNGAGLFNLLQMPAWAEVILALILLDLAIYIQHVATHRVPLLWRLHMVHHTERELDVSTSVRFHPAEIIASLLYKTVIIVSLGIDPVVVIAYEVMLNVMAAFNHANVVLPAWLERPLRLIVVTPALHRIHHSDKPHETNSNFGNTLSIWDRLFGTWRGAPQDGLRIGLTQYQDERPNQLWWCVKAPFERTAP
ncbi:MAG TPA: fatty acid hydroxylase [Alphaproteobacteria bacterium]|nr:fatty acid hydroxylase [Alphaproteobacteria bacterium]HAJ46183.1 fatty acid hydroxylase [Alphaproteobacteria bacterium]